uniref:Uncharacterized protein n=1 Tax=Arundo donax TaxID=35708 RepID=A0A0A9E0T2_ARUDO
MLLLYFAIVSL